MTTEHVVVRLTPDDVLLAMSMAQKCSLGGTSQVRGDDREAALREDQVVGQLGTIALHYYWFGDLQRYQLGRHFQNQQPWTGDGGEDIPAANIDVKTSLMRRSQDPTHYNLCVRPRERHEGWVYVLALVPSDWEVEPRVVLVGWVAEWNLPTTPKADGPLAGAFVVPATQLNSLPPLSYRYQ